MPVAVGLVSRYRSFVLRVLSGTAREGQAAPGDTSRLCFFGFRKCGAGSWERPSLAPLRVCVLRDHFGPQRRSRPCKNKLQLSSSPIPSRTATVTSWPSLKSLSWSIETANPALASRLWSSSENDPRVVAKLLEATHPDYYDTVSWYFGSVGKRSPEWLDDVGRALNTDQMLAQLDHASTGDVSNRSAFA
jgi:hypothetical protein